MDRRLNAYRPDLADIRLKGKVEAARYVEGREMQVIAPVLDVRSAPRSDAGQDTQLLFGERVTVFEEAEGYAWLKAERDGYVGYALGSWLSAEPDDATHVIAVPRTFSYREADMKTAAKTAYSLGSRLKVVGTAETRGLSYALLASGEALVASHLRPIGDTVSDYVSVAETLEHTPYLWGGASAFGIDCSGLVQLSMRMSGQTVLRDTDMQATTIGKPLAIGTDLAGLQRGDLVFWKGHVAIMVDAETIIHANGHTMTVAREPLRQAVDRIAYIYERPTGFRRP
ncbi:C40 family peptidase [Aquamicrobium zhengzhouense]|uniref:C40 family peptidase n=1 Tax=Aquamicrobium zhengzhouense TaxID=2781738 RepID=A0ABS0SGS9_9HYPH|nr:NlpC/P60 family protein [Aquamicrobium zhengzhouense]MBI1621896.1 C40 family peptidase [Aquamicrobium zhengzhouense]